MAIIAQITDLHLRPRGATALGLVQVETFAWRAVETLRALRPRPDLVLVTGDLTDLGEPEAYEVAVEVLQRLPMPVLVMPGNHDLRAPFRAAFDGFAGVGTCARERLCYVAERLGTAVVVLDSLIEGEAAGDIGQEQLTWLDEMLAALAPRPVLIAVHHPPIATGLAHLDRIGLLDSRELGEVVARHAHVRRIVCGHLHRLVVGQIAHVPVMCIPSVAHQVVLDLEPEAPAAFNFEPPTYALHLLREDGDFASHLAYVERFAGPHPFARAPGVEWPNYPPADAAR